MDGWAEFFGDVPQKKSKIRQQIKLETKKETENKKQERSKSAAKVLDCSFYITEQPELEEEMTPKKMKTPASEKNKATCLICCDSQSDSVIMDCGHGGLCF